MIRMKIANKDEESGEESASLSSDVQDENYGAMGNEGSDAEGNHKENDGEAKAMYDNDLLSVPASRKDNRSQKSKLSSANTKSEAGSRASSKSSQMSQGSRTTKKSGKRVRIVLSEDGRSRKKKLKRSKADVKDIMEHCYVLDKFIAETKSQIADQQKLKHLLVENSK